MSSQCYSQYWHSIPVNTDSSLLWGSITNTIHIWRDPRYKWETDHINVVDQRASILELNILFNKHYSRISVMCNNVTVISWFNNVGDKESASCMKIVCNICTSALQRNCGYQQCISQVSLATSDQIAHRSSHPVVFLGKGVLEICSKFTGEQPCWNVISIKLFCNFIEITLQHGFSTVNLLLIFTTSFIKNTPGRLLLGVAL